MNYTDSTPGDRALSEESVLQQWKDRNIFQKTLDKESPRGEFVFYEGPPTANGRPGMHHVEARSFKDIIPRYKTMQGYHVDRKAGWDTHGLPVELQVEKLLGLRSKKEIEQYGVAQFNQKCRESVWAYKSEWEAVTERMGYWVDMDNPYITYHNSYIESCWNVMSRINDRGLLYRDFKVVPWCCRCGTALSSHELSQPGAYQDVRDLSVIAKFKLHSGQKIGEYITNDTTYVLAWTTTPWTLPGNVALAVGADIAYMIAKIDGSTYIFANDLKHAVVGDMAWTELSIVSGSLLAGVTYEPLYGFTEQLATGDNIARMEHAYTIYTANFVTTTDGTGVVHTAVMYGSDDFELGVQVDLPRVHVIDEEGRYYSVCDFLAGRFVKEKNDRGEETVAIDIIRDLAGRGLLYRKEKYNHSYPHCWRCDTPLLYFARDSWYIRMSQLTDQLVASNAGINWEPSHIRDGRFGEWLANIRDWAVSRDRYWGTPLPIWETADRSSRVVIDSVDALRQYARKSGNTYYVLRHGQTAYNVSDILQSSDPQFPNPLTDTGRQQVVQAAQDCGINPDIIIASPFVRTQETAQLFAQTIGFDPGQIQTDVRLSEINHGEFDGQKKQAYQQAFYTDNRIYREAPAGGESLCDVRRRVGELLYSLDQQYQNQVIVLVSHGDAIWSLNAVATGMNEQEMFDWGRDHYPRNAELQRLDFAPLPHNEQYELDLHKPYIDDMVLELPDGTPLQRTPEVADVWFDSGCVPYAQHHYPFAFAPGGAMHGRELPYPADYISEAIDQTRGWFYTMHAIANLLERPPAYNNVVCLGLILDADGKKMSKSRGNVVSPWEMFNQYGADTVRLWMYSVNQPGENKNFDPKNLAELQSKFFRMFENCVSFYQLYAHTDVATEQSYNAQQLSQVSNVLDRWIIALLHKTHADITGYLDQYRVFEASRALRDFVTELSQWYIRRSRDRVKTISDDQRQALATMRYVFIEFAKLCAPFTPFFAETVYGQMNGPLESVHLESWSAVMDSDTEVLDTMERVRDVVSVALERRATAGIKVRQPLQKVTVSRLQVSDEYVEIIKDEVNVKEVLVDSALSEHDVVLDAVLTPELVSEGDAREFIRTVQELRKKRGLVPSDTIVIQVSMMPDFAVLHRDTILSTVGARDITVSNSAANEITISNHTFAFDIVVI